MTMNSAVLPLLVQHEAFVGDPSLLIAFSTASKATRAAVLQQCRGRVAVSFQPRNERQAKLFAQWLTKNVQLLGELTLDGAALKRSGKFSYPAANYVGAELSRQAECLLAEALQQHRQQIGPLPLRQLCHHFGGQEAGAIIQSLSPSTLTSLSIDVIEPYDILRFQVSLHHSHLSAFSNLQSLQLCSLTPAALESLIPAIQAFGHLRFLKLSGLTAELTQQLIPQMPSSLQTLSLAARSCRDSLSLQLQHLTALRSLHVCCLAGDSVMPQQLQGLSCVSYRSVQPLLSCMQLQSLDIGTSSAGESELCSILSSVASLTRISFGVNYSPAVGVDSLAAAFRHSPMNTGLQELSIECGGAGLVPNTIEQLRWLKGLTNLSLSAGYVPLSTTPAQCAASVQHLTALQKLHLAACGLSGSVLDEFGDRRRLRLAGWLPCNIHALTEVIARLSRLTDLALASTGLTAEALEPLGR